MFITLHKSPVGGVKKKVLIYNEKNLTKLWILFPFTGNGEHFRGLRVNGTPCWNYKSGSGKRCGSFPACAALAGYGASVVWGHVADKTFVAIRERPQYASTELQIGIDISRPSSTVVEMDQAKMLPDGEKNESGAVATRNGLAGFFIWIWRRSRQDTQRIMEVILPVASLYGIELATV